MEVVSRKEAAKQGLKFYFTGKACVNGHISERLTGRGTCYSCNKINALKWKKENPDKHTAGEAKRKASKLKATPAWLSEEHYQQIAEFYSAAKELERLFPWKQQVDHIVPLQGEAVCGLHVPWNLQILPEKVNARKKNHFTCPSDAG